MIGRASRRRQFLFGVAAFELQISLYFTEFILQLSKLALLLLQMLPVHFLQIRVGYDPTFHSLTAPTSRAVQILSRNRELA